MQHEPGKGRAGGKGNIGRCDTMGVHVTERDVMVLLTPAPKSFSRSTPCVDQQEVGRVLSML
ncbi:hypothetical protein ABH900_001333 [Stenotrophomonas sp. AN71]